MSVQSEITRLENAKAAIKAAIEGKGVTVPEATLLDGMAILIESIEAGGGAGFFTEIGTYIPAEDITLVDSPLGYIAAESNGIIILPWTKNVSNVKDSLIAVFNPNTGNTIRLCVYWASSQTYNVFNGAFVNDSVCKRKYLRAGAEYLYAHS